MRTYSHESKQRITKLLKNGIEALNCDLLTAPQDLGFFCQLLRKLAVEEEPNRNADKVEQDFDLGLVEYVFRHEDEVDQLLCDGVWRLEEMELTPPPITLNHLESNAV